MPFYIAKDLPKELLLLKTIAAEIILATYIHLSHSNKI
jgi:hypothetical protein